MIYMYRVKAMMFLQDVWHRGAIMIIKKFKFLKRRGLRDGKLTYSGYHELSKEENCLPDEEEPSDDLILSYIKLMNSVHKANPDVVREGLAFDAIPTHLYNDIDLNELVDIRENSAYVAFVQLIGGYINYEEDGYDILAKEYKRELKYSGGNLMKIQIRELIDRSFDEFVNFFTSFPRFEDFQESFQENVTLVDKATKKSSFIKRTVKEANKENSLKKLPTVSMKKTATNLNYGPRNNLLRSNLGSQRITNINRKNTVDEVSGLNKLNTVLHLPDFISNNSFMNPFIELVMTINGRRLKLDKKEEEIVESICSQIKHLD